MQQPHLWAAGARTPVTCSLKNALHVGSVPPPPGGALAEALMEQFARGPFPHPASWQLPPWVAGGFVTPDMAASCERAQDWPFLRLGVVPRTGQRITLDLRYAHDGSHPGSYRGYARMVGHVEEVLPPPPPGVYGRYLRQRVDLGKPALRRLRAQLPALPQLSACGRPYSAQTEEEGVEECGAVHGQRLRCRLRLGVDDEGLLVPQLAGEWHAELVLNLGKEQPWVLCRFEYAGPSELPLARAYPPGKRSLPDQYQNADGSLSETLLHAAPPVRREACAHCGAVGGVKRSGQGEGAAGVAATLRLCADCTSVSYCSPQCQREAWPAHKPACKRVQQRRDMRSAEA